MQNKKTVLIFTDAVRALSASAVKEQLLEELPDAVVIIIDDLELHADAVRDYIENVFKLKVNFEKNRAVREERKLARKIDETPKSSNVYKLQNSYKKMENIFNRYTPDLVVTIGYGAFNEAVAVRDKLGAKTRIASVIDDYALNRQLINTYIDAYVVENMAVKTTLVNNYVKESRITLADIPVRKSFAQAPTQSEVLDELRLEKKLPTLLSVAFAEKGSEQFETLAAYKDKFNILVYTGMNRGAYSEASGTGLATYNEGTAIETLYAAADVVLTNPNSYYVAAARETGKLIALWEPANAIEKRNAAFLSGITADCSDRHRLTRFLRHYPDTRFDAVRNASALSSVRSVGKELIKLI